MTIVPGATLRALSLHARLEVQQRFAGNVLGVFWTAILPLLQLALFALVFVYIFKARESGLPGVGYLEFLALGMWPWLALSEALTRASGALVDNSALLSKVRIAPWHLVFARVAVAFSFHLGGFVLVLLALRATGVELHAGAWPMVLFGWLLLLALALAGGIVLALAAVYLRDLQQLLPPLLTALLFLSPILYPAQAAPVAMRGWLEWNPIGGAIDLVRAPLLTGAVAPGAALLTLLVVAFCALLAWAFHRRLRDALVDFL
jgi:lipopolysaccharide transport system permease protein